MFFKKIKILETLNENCTENDPRNACRDEYNLVCLNNSCKCKEDFTIDIVNTDRCVVPETLQSGLDEKCILDEQCTKG